MKLDYSEVGLERYFTLWVDNKNVKSQVFGSSYLKWGYFSTEKQKHFIPLKEPWKINLIE